MSVGTNRIMVAHVCACLRKITSGERSSATAGEVAKAMQVSRGTAIKYLKMAVADDRVIELEGVHVNNQIMRLYAPVGRYQSWKS